MDSDTQKEAISSLKDELDREKAKRIKAEKLLKDKSRELNESNQRLKALNEALEINILRRTNTLTSLIKNLHAGVLLEDENRRIILVNQKYCEMIGVAYDPEVLIGQDCDDTGGLARHLFEDPLEYEQKTDQKVSDREVVTNEVLKMKNGRVVERDFLPIDSKEGYLGHLWLFRDITDQYNFEKKLRQSEEKYRGIIENMQLGLLEMSPLGLITKVYDSFCKMTGYEQTELIGKQVRELYLNDSSDHYKPDLQRLYENQLRRKNGETIWVLISESPYYDSSGSAGTIGIYYNITHIKRLENELVEAREIAGKAREAEKQFLANMSHEIRNPINAIAGLISLLYDTKLSEVQLDYLNNIKYAADILLGLISDILDLSKIEAGKMELVEKPVEISECIRAMVKTYSFKTSGKNIEFSSDIDPRLSEPVVAAPTVVNQILLNLIGNAVKFTESGEIRVKAVLKSETTDSVEALFTVEDTGIGIPASQLDKIFETFQQADKEIKLRYGGTGLGLAIVKQLLKFYDGEIDVKSQPDIGSTFTFSMKFKKADLDQNKQVESIPMRLASDEINRVLVVEDNVINQKYLMGLLKKWGLMYDMANHGEEALALLEKHLYDLVLMDIRMPVMDGYETTIRIRSSDHNQNRDVPIVALTASALVDEKERALAAGMNYHLTKPFSPEQLLGVLNRIKPSSVASSAGSPEFEFMEELDKKYLQEFYEDDIDRAALMFEIFLGHIHLEVEKLNQLYEDRNHNDLAALAHRIKPNFSMVGLTKFSHLLQEIERCAKQGNPEMLEEIIPHFIEEFKNKVKLVERQLASLRNYASS